MNLTLDLVKFSEKIPGSFFENQHIIEASLPASEFLLTCQPGSRYNIFRQPTISCLVSFLGRMIPNGSANKKNIENLVQEEIGEEKN